MGDPAFVPLSMNLHEAITLEIVKELLKRKHKLIMMKLHSEDTSVRQTIDYILDEIETSIDKIITECNPKVGLKFP